MRYCELLHIPCPQLDDLAYFYAAKDRFSRLPTLLCSSQTLWQTVYEGDWLAQFGLMVATLPCSQASSERVFSSADWLPKDGPSFYPHHSPKKSHSKRKMFALWCILLHFICKLVMPEFPRDRGNNSLHIKVHPCRQPLTVNGLGSRSWPAKSSSDGTSEAYPWENP